MCKQLKYAGKKPVNLLPFYDNKHSCLPVILKSDELSYFVQTCVHIELEIGTAQDSVMASRMAKPLGWRYVSILP